MADQRQLMSALQNASKIAEDPSLSDEQRQQAENDARQLATMLKRMSSQARQQKIDPAQPIEPIEQPEEKMSFVSEGATNFVSGFTQDSFRDASYNVKAGEWLFEEAVDTFGGKTGKLMVAENRKVNRESDVYRKWQPQIWAMQDAIANNPNKQSPEYQAAFEELQNLRKNMRDDMEGTYEPPDEDFSFMEMMAEAGDNKALTAGIFAKQFLADPALLLIPGGWTKAGHTATRTLKAVNALRKVQTGAKAAASAKMAGQITGSAGATVGLGASMRAIDQKDADPDADLNWDEIIAGTKTDLAIGTAIGMFPAGATALNVRNRIKNVSRWKAAKLASENRPAGQTIEQGADSISEIFGSQVKKAEDAAPGPVRDEMKFRAAQADEMAPTADEVKDIFKLAKLKGKDELNTKGDVQDLFEATKQGRMNHKYGYMDEVNEPQAPAVKDEMLASNKRLTPNEKSVRDAEINSAWEQHRGVMQKQYARELGEADQLADAGKIVERQFQQKMDDLFGGEKINPAMREELMAAANKANKADKAQDTARQILESHRRQGGHISTKQMVALSAIAGSGLLGFSANDDIGDGVAGALLAAGGIGAGLVLKKGMTKIKAGLDKALTKRSFNMMDTIGKYDGREAAVDLATMRFNEQLKLLLNPAERKQVTGYIQGTLTDVSDNVKKASVQVREFYDNWFRISNENGVISSYVDDFVPSLYKKRDQTAAQEFFASRGMGSGGTNHSRQRLYQTIEDGKAAGLVPKTEDITEINGMYAKSVGKAINNKLVIDEMMDSVAPDGLPLVSKSLPDGVSPDKYVTIDNNALRNKNGSPMYVHKQAADSVGLMFSDPSGINDGVKLLNLIMKRNLVSMSLFHAKALVESSMMAMGLRKGSSSNVKLLKEFKKRGSHPALEQLYYGHAGDEVDKFVRAGLTISRIEDVGGDKFKVLMQNFDDKLAESNVLGKAFNKVAFRPYKNLMENIDTLMWDKVMTANKLMAAMDNYKRLKVRNHKMHMKNSEKYPLVPDDVLRQQASEFVNDAFGGLNWRRLGEKAQSQLFHKIFSKAYSQKGRDWMQLGLFAPDWTIANIRIIGKALGLTKEPATMLHRQYAMRGLLMFLAGQQAANQMLHGENYPGFDALGVTDKEYDWEAGEESGYKDLYYLGIGDGDYMQVTKQLIEPPKWLFMPRGELLNKAGILPKMVGEVLGNKEYLNPKNLQYAPDIYRDDESIPWEYTKYLAKKMLPIAGGQALSKDDDGEWYLDWVRAASGALGFPIYRGKED